MSAWSERNRGASPVAGLGGRTYTGTSGATSASGGIYHPTGGGGDSGNAVDVNPGSFDINPLDPSESATNAEQGLGSLFNGLRQALFGGNEQTPEGELSRQKSMLGGIPLVGDAGRVISDVGGAAGEVIGGAAGVVGGTAERVPTGAGEQIALQAAFDEANQAGMQAWLDEVDPETGQSRRAQFAGDEGLLGTGILSNKQHMMSAAVRAFRKDQAIKNPTLAPGAFTVPGSLADQLNNVIDLLDASSQAGGRLWSTFDTPGQGGMDRLDIIKAVGDGKVAFEEDKGLAGTGFLAGDPTTGLNALEELVYVKTKNGEWTDDEARDFLASNGQAFGHSAIANIGGAVAFDPLNIATAGAGAIAKVGATGARIATRVADAAADLSRAEDALAAAKATLDAAKGARKVKAATKAFDAATEARDAAAKTAKALETYSSPKLAGASKVNVIARAAEGKQGVQDFFKLAGKAYNGLEGTSVGRAAKLTRTLIDPLHAVDLRMPGSARAVDLLSDAIPKSIVDTAGVHHYKSVLDELVHADPTGGMMDQFTKDIGVASANMGRETLLEMFRSTQLAGGLGEELMSKSVDELLDMAVASTKQKDLNKMLRFKATQVLVQRQWSKTDIDNLARGMAKAYPARTAEEWGAILQKGTIEFRSLAKLGVYGNLNRTLLNFVADASTKTAGASAGLAPKLGRLVLLSKKTFTRLAAEDLLATLKATKGSKNKAVIIREAQARYPNLRYIPLDPGNLGKSVDDFVEYVSDSLEKFPMQATTAELDELATMGDEVGDLQDLLGDAYSIGFKPDEQFLHGLERANGSGLYRAAGEAWVDHVADGAVSYRPAQYMRTNIMGHPIVNIPGVRAVAKVADHMDSAARIFKQQVHGAQVMEVAKQRFVQDLPEDLAEAGLTESVATQWWEAITKYTREHQGYSGPRGLSKGDLYAVLKDNRLIPKPMLNGARVVQPSDILTMVLRAYDGDMRYIGLTQKLSSRVKSMLSLGGEVNFAGQIAEHVWPTLKFRVNPIFQLQEKIEPWVLNAQRGVSLATGTRKLSKEDDALELLLQKMTDYSLVRQADLDQFEYSSRILLGKSLQKTAATPGSRLNRLNGLGPSLLDVQGMKRLNMLRTFKKGLGKEIRAAWDEANPGMWDTMKREADLRAGKVLDDDDFALGLVGEQQYANDIIVRRFTTAAGKSGFKADWGNAIKTGAWHTPTNLGELKPLDLDHVAESMRWTRHTDGSDIENLQDLRAAIAAKEVTIDDVADGLRRLNADEDYIRRVSNALDFSWGGFWKTATQRFGLEATELKALQDMMAGAARVRGMTPVDFMSQVFSPGIRDGVEGTLGSLDGPLTILRQAREAGRKLKRKEARLAETRTVLAGKEGVSTRADLIRQISRTFSAHLDPSAKRTLLMEFKPELRKAISKGEVKFDLSELQAMWDDEAQDMLATRIIGYMDGVEPTGAHSLIDDEARGVKAARDAADQYMRRAGVTPQAGRRYFAADDVLYEDSARAYSALPSTPFERTGRKPTIGQVQKSGTDLKPRPEGVDERTYQAYQDFVVDTRAQWDYMTSPKGMNLKVIIAKSDPYPDSAAMRADVAKGRLRVFPGNSDHPLMTNEQNVMFRAVHDVFGHAAEGFEFGPRGELNAAIKHSAMYSDTGRAAMLTETHGQTSWVNFSDDVVPGIQPRTPLDAADPVADFESRHPFKMPDWFDETDPDSPRFIERDLDGFTFQGETATAPFQTKQRLGDDLRTEFSASEQASFLDPMDDLLTRAPDVEVYHLDAPEAFHEPIDFGGLGQEPSVNGVTWGAEDSEAIVMVSPDMLRDWADPGSRKVLLDRWEATKKNTQFKDIETGVLGPRKSAPGTPANAGVGPAHVATHEWGHAVDLKMRPDSGYLHTGAALPEYEAYGEFIEAYLDSVARTHVSEYAMSSDHEAVADLFALAFNPEVKRATLHPEVQLAIKELEDVLDVLGVVKKATPHPAAGKTVRAANAAQRGTVYAEQKAALLPQDILDRFGEQFVGRGKHVETNPDVARTAQMFGKWTDAVVTNGLLRGEKGQYANILGDVAGIPTKAAVPYNFSEAAAINLATNSMVEKWDDAFRLQYFNQSRTMLERTVNHPMFGLYPASYMWGKILPEIARFIALEPFGQKTGGLLYSLMDVKANIALRREFDPVFDKHIEDTGHSPALNMLGYLLPSLPWEVHAGAPAWMRNLAQQGLTQAKDIAEGEAVDGIDVLGAGSRSLQQLNPMVQNLGRVEGAVQDVLGAPTKTPEEAQFETDEYVQAAELEGRLADVMQELREALGR